MYGSCVQSATQNINTAQTDMFAPLKGKVVLFLSCSGVLLFVGTNALSN